MKRLVTVKCCLFVILSAVWFLTPIAFAQNNTVQAQDETLTESLQASGGALEIAKAADPFKKNALRSPDDSIDRIAEVLAKLKSPKNDGFVFDQDTFSTLVSVLNKECGINVVLDRSATDDELDMDTEISFDMNGAMGVEKVGAAQLLATEPPHAILAMVTKAVTPGQWKSDSSTENAELSLVDGMLIVYHNNEGIRGVERFLTHYRRALNSAR